MGCWSNDFGQSNCSHRPQHTPRTGLSKTKNLNVVNQSIVDSFTKNIQQILKTYCGCQAQWHPVNSLCIIIFIHPASVSVHNMFVQYASWNCAYYMNDQLFWWRSFVRQWSKKVQVGCKKMEFKIYCIIVVVVVATNLWMARTQCME